MSSVLKLLGTSFISLVWTCEKIGSLKIWISVVCRLESLSCLNHLEPHTTSGCPMPSAVGQAVESPNSQKVHIQI